MRGAGGQRDAKTSSIHALYFGGLMRLISMLGLLIVAAIVVGTARGEDSEQATKQRQAIRAKMKAAAKGKPFTDAVKQIAAATGSEAKPLETEEDDTGGFVFSTTHAKAEELLK